ncbi:GNAT family N-acetyltransferase [Brucella oryzae]|uniref:GNAT family N-acetyltransferase n=1 Tax=Brucella oryzae TaxID=335286 RepID=UPI001B83C554|nr:GNAT family N-acetyltransferase [Brucella oryzae]MBR7653435.1 GNAT family N-acetyltransferase [Brucella oryzae]
MTQNDVVIRPFNLASDTRTLSAIWLNASLIAHHFIGRQRLLEQRVLIEEQYLPSSETWVACQETLSLGFISLLDKFVGGIFVAPGQQGKGVGRQLIAYALERKGELTLEVYTQNEQALRFYTSLGFREVSRRPYDDEGLPFENARLTLST